MKKILLLFFVFLIPLSLALHPYSTDSDLNKTPYSTEGTIPVSPQTYQIDNKAPIVSSINNVWPAYNNIDLTSDGNIIIVTNPKTSQIQLNLKKIGLSDLNLDSNVYVLKTGDTMSGPLLNSSYIAANGGILSEGATTEYALPTGNGTRFLWIPSKAALRAGILNGIGTESYWDLSNIGDYSIALGQNVEATGSSSISLGSSNLSTAANAISIGTSVSATASRAIAIGSQNTTAIGVQSIAIGDNCEANFLDAIAIGHGAKANYLDTVAIGSGVVADNTGSVAMGINFGNTIANSFGVGFSTDPSLIITEQIADFQDTNIITTQKVSANKIDSNSFCLNENCISAWPSSDTNWNDSDRNYLKLTGGSLTGDLNIVGKDVNITTGKITAKNAYVTDLNVQKIDWNGAGNISVIPMADKDIYFFQNDVTNGDYTGGREIRIYGWNQDKTALNYGQLYMDGFGRLNFGGGGTGFLGHQFGNANIYLGTINKSLTFPSQGQYAIGATDVQKHGGTSGTSALVTFNASTGGATNRRSAEILFAPAAARTYLDYALPYTTNPNVCVMSGSGAVTNQYMCLQHDLTNARLYSSTGSLNLEPPTTVKIGTGQAGIDYNLVFNGQDNNGYIQWMEDENNFKINASTQFDKNVNISGNLTIDGNVSFKRPYGMFSSMKTQTIPDTTLAYYMDFNTTEDSFEMIINADKNEFMVQQTGDYLIEISVIATSTIAGKLVNVWTRKNGVDIPRSNTVYQFKQNNYIAVIAVPFIIDLNMTDKFSIMYSGDSTGITLPVVPLSLNPPAPATPSAIMTFSKISEITD